MNNLNSSELIIFSSSYPVNNGEPFLSNEIELLVNKFERVVVICSAEGDSWYWDVPTGVEVIQVSSYNKSFNVNYFKIFSIVLTDLLHGGTSLNTVRENLSSLKSLLHMKKETEICIRSLGLKNPIFYSYWFDEWATILAVLKKEKAIPFFISRTHRFDLFEELRPNGTIPFRYLQLLSVSKVYSVSEMGTLYIKDRYPKFNHKFSTSRLGTFDVGSNFSSPENHIHIVTCSRVVPVKRLELIVDLLETWKSSKRIKWSHLGDGPGFEELRLRAQRVSSKNDLVEVDFIGHLKNSQVLEFYRENEITAFVNVSSSEGLPVSLMEAASFGIPLIGTDVGGTKEIVNEHTGVLLDAKPEIEQILESILLVQSKYSGVSERKKIKEYWKAHFSAIDNYHAFVDELKSL